MRKNGFWLFSIFALMFALLISCSIFSSLSSAYAVSDEATSLPNAFSLFDLSDTSLYDDADNVETADLPRNVGNQRGTNICWTFATNTALETSIYMKAKSDTSFTPSSTLNFSELNIAHTLLKKRGYTKTAGGSIDLATEYLTSEYGPVWEENWEHNVLTSDEYAFNQYDSRTTLSPATPADYSLMDAYYFSSRKELKSNYSGTELDEKLLDLRQSIKSHIYNYGATTATIYMSNDYLTGYTYLVDSEINQNHMITLVGWNDDYQFVKNHVTHTGAYIAQNSYGTSFGSGGYFYIMYDDCRVEDNVCGFTKIGRTLSSSVSDPSAVTMYSSTEGLEYNGKDYENLFVNYTGNTVWVGTFTKASFAYYATNIFKLDTSSSVNNIARIKIPCASPFNDHPETTFKVYILDGLDSNIENVANISGLLSSAMSNKILVRDGDGRTEFTSRLTGFYTIDLGANLISLTGEYFAVVMAIEAGDGVLLYMVNNDATLEQTYHNSFLSTNNGSSWSLLKVGTSTPSQYTILPMMVETISDLGSISYTAEDTTTTYSGEGVSPSISVASPSNYTIQYFVNNAWTTVKPTFYNAGTYTVPFKIIQTGYETVTDTVNITINKKTLTITPRSGQQKEYRRSDPSPLAYDVAGVVDGDQPEFYGSLIRASGETVGDYLISQGSLVVLDANYEISFASNVYFTITRRTLTITPNYRTSVYGESLSTLTYSYSGGVSSETPNIDISLYVTKLDTNDQPISSVVVEDAGYYDVYYSSLTLLDTGTFSASNYTAVFSGGHDKYYISPRTLYITPDDLSKTYKGSDPVFTFSYSGQVSPQIPQFTGSLSRDAGEDSGIYPINLGDLELADNGAFKASNYTLSLSDTHYLTIVNANLYGEYTINDANFIYDGLPHSITVDFDAPITALYMFVNDAGVQFNEGLSQSALPTYINVGTYIVKVQFSAPNYDSAIEVATLTITRRTLIVTPNATSKLYGGEDNLTYSYEGEVVGQTPSFTGRISREEGENVGTYAITLGTLSLKDNGSFKSGNYSLSFTSGIVYSIERRPIEVSPIIGQSKLYNTEDEVLRFRYTGGQYQDVISFTGALSREEGEDVGRYDILIGSLALESRLDGNYYITLSPNIVYYSITPQTLVIQVNDKTSYYGETDDEFSCYIVPSTLPNYKVGDDLMVTYSCLDDKGQPVGDSTLRKDSGYIINAHAGNNNYNITIQSGRYYIVYRQYDVTFVVFDDSYTFQFSHFDRLGDVVSKIDIEKKGYQFSYWQDSSTSYEDVSDYIVEGDVTFTGVYDVVTLHISYKENGGYFNEGAVYTFNVNSEIELPTPIKIGHNFEGFYLDADFTSRKVTSINKDFDEDITLFAKWTPKEYEVTLPTSTDSSYAISASSPKAVYGKNYVFSLTLDYAYDKSSVIVNCTYTKSGSVVRAREVYRSRTTSTSGLNLAQRGNTIIGYSIDNIQDSELSIDVSGVNVNTYNVYFRVFSDMNNYKADDISKYKSPAYSQICATVPNITHGESLGSIPEPPHRDHYTQVTPVWDRTDFSSITEDMDVYAIYYIDTYTVTYLCDDGSEYATTVAYGEQFSTRPLERELGLSFMYKIVYNQEDMPSTPIVTGDMTIHYYILDYSLYVVYAIFGILGLILLYFIISFLHYKIYLFKRRRLGSK